MTDASATLDLADRVSARALARLRAFRRDAELALPGRIANVVLFGSRARGDSRRDSDYDVAVFVRRLSDRREIDHALADAAYPHILAGIHIRPVAVPVDYLRVRPRTLLAVNLARDGLAIP